MEMAVIEARKLNENLVVRKKNWGKWKADKKVQAMFGIKPKN